MRRSPVLPDSSDGAMPMRPPPVSLSESDGTPVFRTYADNLGGRVFLSGGLDGQRMVMTGTRSLADGTQQRVRVSWTPESADRVVEAWELSPDDGATWVPAQEVVRIRRS